MIKAKVETIITEVPSTIKTTKYVFKCPKCDFKLETIYSNSCHEADVYRHYAQTHIPKTFRTLFGECIKFDNEDDFDAFIKYPTEYYCFKDNRSGDGYNAEWNGPGTYIINYLYCEEGDDYYELAHISKQAESLKNSIERRTRELEDIKEYMKNNK